MTFEASRLMVLAMTAPQPSLKALVMTLRFVPGGPEPMMKGFGSLRPSTVVASVGIGLSFYFTTACPNINAEGAAMPLESICGWGQFRMLGSGNSPFSAPGSLVSFLTSRRAHPMPHRKPRLSPPALVAKFAWWTPPDRLAVDGLRVHAAEHLLKRPVQGRRPFAPSNTAKCTLIPRLNLSPRSEGRFLAAGRPQILCLSTRLWSNLLPSDERESQNLRDYQSGRRIGRRGSRNGCAGFHVLRIESAKRFVDDGGGHHSPAPAFHRARGSVREPGRRVGEKRYCKLRRGHAAISR